MAAHGNSKLPPQLISAISLLVQDSTLKALAHGIVAVLQIFAPTKKTWIIKYTT